MKKRFFLFYALLVLAYIVLSARSCSDTNQENEILFVKELEIIEKELSTDEPDPKNLLAFEERAKQKITDLVDYLNIYYNTDLDPVFKKNAMEGIQNLFFPYQSENTDSVLILLKNKLDKYFINPNKDPASSLKLQFELDSIQLIEPLFKRINDDFRGKIAFMLTVKEGYEIEILTSRRFDSETEIRLQKVKKIFGDKSIAVWKVFLGDVNLQ